MAVLVKSKLNRAGANNKFIVEEKRDELMNQFKTAMQIEILKATNTIPASAESSALQALFNYIPFEEIPGVISKMVLFKPFSIDRVFDAVKLAFENVVMNSVYEFMTDTKRLPDRPESDIKVMIHHTVSHLDKCPEDFDIDLMFTNAYDTIRKVINILDGHNPEVLNYPNKNAVEFIATNFYKAEGKMLHKFVRCLNVRPASDLWEIRHLEEFMLLEHKAFIDSCKNVLTVIARVMTKFLRETLSNDGFSDTVIETVINIPATLWDTERNVHDLRVAAGDRSKRVYTMTAFIEEIPGDKTKTVFTVRFSSYYGGAITRAETEITLQEIIQLRRLHDAMYRESVAISMDPNAIELVRSAATKLNTMVADISRMIVTTIL